MGSTYYSKRLKTKRPKPGAGAPPRPKAFKSEAAAHEWAKEYKVKKYIVDSIAGGTKFKVRTRF
jgi:hypothetical protein